MFKEQNVIEFHELLSSVLDSRQRKSVYVIQAEMFTDEERFIQV